MTQNQIRYQELQENKRHNLISEHETGRHNAVTEQLQHRELDETVRTHQVNEGIAMFNANETKRSNVARELETSRSNLARERETNRSNLAKEAETNRANLATEQIRRDELTEKNRHNVADETIRDYSAVTQRYTVSPDKLIGTALIGFEPGSSPLGNDVSIGKGGKSSNLLTRIDNMEHNLWTALGSPNLFFEGEWYDAMLKGQRAPETTTKGSLYELLTK